MTFLLSPTLCDGSFLPLVFPLCFSSFPRLLRPCSPLNYPPVPPHHDPIFVSPSPHPEMDFTTPPPYSPPYSSLKRLHFPPPSSTLRYNCPPSLSFRRSPYTLGPFFFPPNSDLPFLSPPSFFFSPSFPPPR